MNNSNIYTLRNLADCIHDEAIFALEFVEKCKKHNNDNEDLVTILEEVIYILRKTSGWAGCISINLKYTNIYGYGVAINLSETLVSWTDRLIMDVLYGKIYSKYKCLEEFQDLDVALNRVERRVKVLCRLFGSLKDNGK